MTVIPFSDIVKQEDVRRSDLAAKTELLDLERLALLECIRAAHEAAKNYKFNDAESELLECLQQTQLLGKLIDQLRRLWQREK